MNESNNTFVSSRGILKSCDWFSTTPQSSIQRMINYPPLQAAKPNQIRTFYICSSTIPYFISHILPNLKKPFILVGGDCDKTIPNDIFPSTKAFDEFIDNPLLLHWFSQNLAYSHPKMTAIPIGLDYHTISSIGGFGEPDTFPADQESQMFFTRENSVPFWERANKCYANFHFSMNTRYGYDRKQAIQQIRKELVFYEYKPVKRSLTWQRQTDFAFVISPHGNGYDCHRLWEALVLGCIPIVKTSVLDNLYEDLPVLIVKEWSDITKKLLDETIEEFKEKHELNEFNYDKLTLKYWVDKINSYKIQPLITVMRSEEPNEITEEEPNEITEEEPDSEEQDSEEPDSEEPDSEDA